ncbi:MULTISPECIES: cysteine hydrolase [unclassified Curtobacterium]|uniref:cysteine hydrolase n=1 Tax=unclassified Curtobacterium TaxID=257496 RepID=UPI000DAA0C21|nr:MULTISPECIES: cysteine hydrolase [unclassified Curtobacterium]QZQ53858.1 cysteine hydrolase [Curtobacterium sp. TC1]WIE70424.1 cysteine hydrolase [Curtobacterium sp. MCJR17_020]
MTTTAVLVVDMQNDTVHAEGAFAETGAAAHAASQNVIENVRRITEAARTSGSTVFHNRIVVYPGELGGSNAPIFRMLGPESFKLGSWGAQIVDELTPVDGDIVLDRNRMSVFNGTGIDFMLRNLGVDHVVVVGAWTNMAVEHSVRDAADHGYAVTIVSDATSSLSEDWQHAALNFALQNIATVTTTDEVVADLAV